MAPPGENLLDTARCALVCPGLIDRQDVLGAAELMATVLKALLQGIETGFIHPKVQDEVCRLAESLANAASHPQEHVWRAVWTALGLCSCDLEDACARTLARTPLPGSTQDLERFVSEWTERRKTMGGCPDCSSSPQYDPVSPWTELDAIRCVILKGIGEKLPGDRLKEGIDVVEKKAEQLLRLVKSLIVARPHVHHAVAGACRDAPAPRGDGFTHVRHALWVLLAGLPWGDFIEPPYRAIGRPGPGYAAEDFNELREEIEFRRRMCAEVGLPPPDPQSRKVEEACLALLDAINAVEPLVQRVLFSPMPPPPPGPQEWDPGETPYGTVVRFVLHLRDEVVAQLLKFPAPEREAAARMLNKQRGPLPSYYKQSACAYLFHWIHRWTGRDPTDSSAKKAAVLLLHSFGVAPCVIPKSEWKSALSSVADDRKTLLRGAERHWRAFLRDFLSPQ